MNQSPRISRREALHRAGIGFGALGLGALMANEEVLAGRAQSPMAPRAPHFAPRAKYVLHYFLNGGLSQVDSFDHKPLLEKFHDKSVPFTDPALGEHTGKGMRSPFKFKKYGSNGLAISELFAKTGEIIDEFCVVRSMHTSTPAHEQASMLMNSGTQSQDTPTMGSWLTYGLGTENQNLPGYVALCPGNGQQPTDGAKNWRSAFLPPIYQGTYIDTHDTSDPEKLVAFVRNNYVGTRQQRRQLNLLQSLNRKHLAERNGDGDLEARIQSYEMAFRMQAEAFEAFDLSQEPQHVLDLYGNDRPAKQLLIARRLIERGVRCVQAWQGPNQPFDNHNELIPSLDYQGRMCDTALSAFVKDLKQRGLLDDTLIVVCGEFGRLPTVQKYPDGMPATGRAHNAEGFTCLLAGGGIKPGMIYGATDELGYKAVENRMHVHDLHATILHLMGIDHEKLTYRHAGRDFRLTDVHGRIVHDILA